jgi:hypothetical protein
MAMLDRLTRLFNPENPRRDAEMAFSRLVSQCGMESLPYREGLAETRREQSAHVQAMGVLVMDQHPDSLELAAFASPIPAVTFDFRRMGVGILLRRPLESSLVVVAIPDKEELWRLFQSEVRHQSARPGGWIQVGLKLLSIYEPQPDQMALLRKHLTSRPHPEESRELCW